MAQDKNIDWKKHETAFSALLKDLGEDPTRDGLLKTPDRHIKSLQFLTSGYDVDVASILNKALFDVEYKDMIIVRDIAFFSLCEHHILPFQGRVHVGYIPSEKVVGLSKIPRLVDAFARRLQVQERMTHQIAQTIQEVLAPEGVGVVIEASHMCMMMRGVEKRESYTTTSSMQGSFNQAHTRQEFLNLVHSPRKWD
ncbi:MAG: GTP cyclohydrolase I FolE [Proteobacteria bacterium]|nr:MAG: GTP cyclohydrolase I FolE [Pseudomonadota bacterium]